MRLSGDMLTSPTQTIQDERSNAYKLAVPSGLKAQAEMDTFIGPEQDDVLMDQEE